MFLFLLSFKFKTIKLLLYPYIIGRMWPILLSLYDRKVQL